MYVYRRETNTYEEVEVPGRAAIPVIHQDFEPQCLAPLPTLREIEQRTIFEALKRTNGVVAAAAQLLGITVRVMHYKIREHGLLEHTHIETQKKVMQFARRQAQLRKVG